MKKIVTVLILITCIFLITGCTNKNTKDSKETKTEVANPLTELSSKEELENMVGFEVPIIEEKEIISYIAIGSSDKKNHARILYQDGSELDMIKGIVKDQEEISGIYGPEKKDTINIKNKKIKIYEYEETIYGVWNDSNYSYSYSMQSSNVNTLQENINLLIKD